MPFPVTLTFSDLDTARRAAQAMGWRQQPGDAPDPDALAGFLRAALIAHVRERVKAAESRDAGRRARAEAASRAERELRLS